MYKASLMKKTIFAIFLLCSSISIAQSVNDSSEDLKITDLIDGTLLKAKSTQPTPLLIIIGDSGPSDRNGNQMMMKNNSLRYLAEGLWKRNISSFRYDKRILKIMKMGEIQEEKINFDHFITDAKAVLNHFKNDARFSTIYILGHGQGSLVGMIAAQENADGFISIAGAGQALDDMIVDQLALQSPGLKDNARESFDDLRVNGVALNYSPGIASIFRPSIQPFLYTWMQYDPAEEMKKLDMPVLIVTGDKDLQVQVTEAELLKKARPQAQLEIIQDMNHIFKKIKGDDIENSKSYNEYNRPVMPELIELIANFILQD
jgi:pimeloyl-ACP methyl ester carboxylesterase